MNSSFNSLNDYNEAYVKYLSCLNLEGSDCSYNLLNTLNTIDNLHTKLNTTIKFKNDDDIKKFYDENNDLRDKLNFRLEQLYGVKKELLYKSSLNDSIIYSTLVWTVLITSCLYVIFVKIK